MDILERIAVALERQNELLELSNAGRDAAIAAAKAASEKVAGAKTTKPAAAKEEPKAAAPKEDTKPAATADETDGPTVADVNKAITDYVGASDREEERSARKTKVRNMLAKYSPEGTEKPTGATLAADKRAAFIKTTAKWLAEGDLTTPPEPDASEDDDNLLDD